MHFAGHAKGGVVAGAAAVAMGAGTGYAPLDGEALAALAAAPFAPGPLFTLAGLFATAWFMALFPDLDVASVPQRWFLRAMCVALWLAYVAGRLDVFAVLAFAALAPLLHRHRGWTHWPVTPWALAFALALVHEHFRAQAAWFFGFSWANVWGFLGDYWAYVAAAVLGHGTHLVLDRPRVRGLPFVRNPPDHH